MSKRKTAAAAAAAAAASDSDSSSAPAPAAAAASPPTHKQPRLSAASSPSAAAAGFSAFTPPSSSVPVLVPGPSAVSVPVNRPFLAGHSLDTIAAQDAGLPRVIDDLSDPGLGFGMSQGARELTTQALLRQQQQPQPGGASSSSAAAAAAAAARGFELAPHQQGMRMDPLECFKDQFVLPRKPAAAASAAAAAASPVKRVKVGGANSTTAAASSLRGVRLVITSLYLFSCFSLFVCSFVFRRIVFRMPFSVAFVAPLR